MHKFGRKQQIRIAKSFLLGKHCPKVFRDEEKRSKPRKGRKMIFKNQMTKQWAGHLQMFIYFDWFYFYFSKFFRAWIIISIDLHDEKCAWSSEVVKKKKK